MPITTCSLEENQGKLVPYIERPVQRLVIALDKKILEDETEDPGVNPTFGTFVTYVQERLQRPEDSGANSGDGMP